METDPTLDIRTYLQLARPSSERPPNPQRHTQSHTQLHRTSAPENPIHMSLSSLLYFVLFGEGKLTNELR
jgi:hypothetical protein